MQQRTRTVLVLLLVCLLGSYVRAMSTTSTTIVSTTTPSPVEHKGAASKEIVTKIVKSMKTLAEHHQLPHWLQQQIYPIGDPLPEHIHLVKEMEPATLDSSIYSATGYHMKGMLGFVEYLILLIIMKIQLDGVAAKYKASLKKKEPLLGKNKRDLTGLDELSHRVLQHLH